MGGYGSGRWQLYDKKTTVEDCRSLSTTDLLRGGFLQPGQTVIGLTSRWYVGERETSSIGVDVYAGETDNAYCRLHYNQSGRQYAYFVDLVTTEPHFGGVQWWFICPLCHESRCRKLYLPPSGGHFGCRSCHDLTYESSQTSDKRVDQLRKMPVLDLLRGMQDGSVDFLTGLKAIPDDVWRGRW